MAFFISILIFIIVFMCSGMGTGRGMSMGSGRGRDGFHVLTKFPIKFYEKRLGWGMGTSPCRGGENGQL